MFTAREQCEVPWKDPSTARPKDGRIDARPDEVIDLDDPDMAAKINAGWLRLASEHGLLNADREFLIDVDYCEPESEPAWVRVRLDDEWDIADSGVEQLRGHFAAMFTTRFVPEFRAASVDLRVAMLTTIWGNGTVSSIVLPLT
jgi:hypothetical protein